LTEALFFIKNRLVVFLLSTFPMNETVGRRIIRRRQVFSIAFFAKSLLVPFLSLKGEEK